MTGYHQYKLCIEACLTCAALCNNCVTACLKEEDPKLMVACIQLNLECSAICYVTARLMSLDSERVKEMAKICAVMCDACADECGKHMNDHCQECAVACKKCADECEIV